VRPHNNTDRSATLFTTLFSSNPTHAPRHHIQTSHKKQTPTTKGHNTQYQQHLKAPTSHCGLVLYFVLCWDVEVVVMVSWPAVGVVWCCCCAGVVLVLCWLRLMLWLGSVCSYVAFVGSWVGCWFCCVDYGVDGVMFVCVVLCVMCCV